ncbi:unnamed protein product [Tilletia laevis]|uniref:Glucosidase 2 subunit beta n=1 Tax=Tilletia controversa TaxID=13291 RepID=A0A8X7MW10_9BASI|nr:hypothetical protein A4X06_0g2309 [Tilletia controversa]CAD6949478.1 unnamed protein product [Tilletia laevis]CAD6971819.1 unnamed protein product [Tilletia controversa]
MHFSLRSKRQQSRSQSVAAVTAASAILLALPLASSASKTVKGVAPKDAHLYAALAGKADAWKCLNSSQEIRHSAINNNFCDCEDGTDEPGTSACTQSRFYCANEGHIPAYILSSRVSDSVCDPECCDGSDEADNPHKDCPNVCAKVGKAHREKATKAEAIRNAGAKTRAKYISDVRRKRIVAQAEVDRLEVEVKVAEERNARLQEALKRAEQADQVVIQEKMASPLYGNLKSYQESLKALGSKNDDLKAELKTLTSLLDDLANNYNPNYQDMAVKGAVMAYKSWRRGGSQDSETDEAEGGAAADGDSTKKITEEPPVKLNGLLEEGEWTAEKLRGLQERDLLEMLDGAEAGKGGTEDDGILFRIHEYLPDALVPTFEALVDTFLDLLLKTNVITTVKRKRPSTDTGAEPENVVKVRNEANAASKKLGDLERDLKDKRAELDLDPKKHGREGEFKALEGTCIQKEVAEYTYELCFGRGTHQKTTKGGMSTAMGSFERFDPFNKSNEKEDEYYMTQLYANGAHCWNGPARSVNVQLSCGLENELVEVFEAEKCIYSMKFFHGRELDSPPSAHAQQPRKARHGTRTSKFPAQHIKHTHTFNMGKVHGSLARAGKVKSQCPKVEKQEKAKRPKGRAHKRLLYTRRFVNATVAPGGKRRMNPNNPAS